jgi:hypothetical protein
MRAATLITPPVNTTSHINHNTLSPRSVGTKTSGTHSNTSDAGRFQHILHGVSDIDEIQARKDPNYNSAYAWSIARMKQDEEVSGIQLFINLFIVCFCFCFFSLFYCEDLVKCLFVTAYKSRYFCK